MILVIGAAASGKRAYAASLGFSAEDMADAVLDKRLVLHNLQALVAHDPAGAPALLPALTEKALVLCDEVGCGVIPEDPAARAARVATGRLCILLAQRAKRVVRLVCGIPSVLYEAAEK